MESRVTLWYILGAKRKAGGSASDSDGPAVSTRRSRRTAARSKAEESEEGEEEVRVIGTLARVSASVLVLLLPVG